MIGTGIFTTPVNPLCVRYGPGTSARRCFGPLRIFPSHSYLTKEVLSGGHTVVSQPTLKLGLAVPHSGTQKNYLEYISRRPKELMRSVKNNSISRAFRHGIQRLRG